MLARYLVAGATLAAIAGCSSDSRQELANEAAILVLPGMSLNEASQSLETAGFDCGDNYLSNFQAADLLCSRTRSHYGVASCVQRIFLTATPRSPAKVQAAVWQPSCTGL